MDNDSNFDSSFDYKSFAKKCDADKLQETMRAQSAIFAVDLLTDYEIDELKELAELKNEKQSEQIQKKLEDPATSGIYKQLIDTGFIEQISVFGDKIIPASLQLSPKAYWAIERRAKMKRQEEERHKYEHRQRVYDRVAVFAGGIIGFFIGLIGSFVYPLIIGL